MSALGARAAASGEQVVFASASPDRALVAHELTHVVQQRGGGGGVQRSATLSQPGDASEREADLVAARVAAGAPAGAIGAQPGAAVRREVEAEGIAPAGAADVSGQPQGDVKVLAKEMIKQAKDHHELTQRLLSDGELKPKEEGTLLKSEAALLTKWQAIEAALKGFDKRGPEAAALRRQIEQIGRLIYNADGATSRVTGRKQSPTTKKIRGGIYRAKRQLAKLVKGR